MHLTSLPVFHRPMWQQIILIPVAIVCIVAAVRIAWRQIIKGDFS